MRTQKEMFDYLKVNLPFHTVNMKNNTIIAKRNFRISDSFSSFIIRYLKKGNQVSIKNISYPSYTKRYDNDEDLFCLMGAMGDIKC